MSEIAQYSYSKGSISQITEGSLERTLFEGRFSHFSELLSDRNKQLLQPNVIGIYQGVVSDTWDPSEIEEHEKLSKLLSQANNLAISNSIGVKDPIHSDLIHLIYDPLVWINRDLVSQFLDDPLYRIAISPIGNVPDFYSKNPELILEGDYAERFKEIIQYKDRDELFEKKVLELIEERKPYYAELAKKWKVFGLTRPEWFCLINPPDNKKKILRPNKDFLDSLNL